MRSSYDWVWMPVTSRTRANTLVSFFMWTEPSCSASSPRPNSSSAVRVRSHQLTKPSRSVCASRAEPNVSPPSGRTQVYAIERTSLMG
ncbi:hypothetical protein CP970_07115 [Streptomyces kanamyceticus]|uniref:Uncharacterized protein n=1 Tax=Streptomyces kanamyceticus TaxID=1967 RepID=A0A5J6G9U5_STRKN|nr:hypothetical protein CP970_07115 [Streptomyces kanamyceticus]